MAKDNLFLGFGRGSVGDVVFSRINGQQVARARNRSPRNPQTPLQLLQRVVMKTTASAYSLMQDICNHSFQGYAEGTECQSQFVKRNVEVFRNLLKDYINSGDPEEILGCQETNFTPKFAQSAVLNPYVISEGTLPEYYPYIVGIQNRAFFQFLFKSDLDPWPAEMQEMTYAQFVQASGLQRGDQLTIIYLKVDDRVSEEDATGYINGFSYGRFILEPSDGNMEAQILDSNEALLNPNPRNVNIQSVVLGSQSTAHYFGLQTFDMGSQGSGEIDTCAACALIVSRLVGGVWQRSPAKLLCRSAAVGSAAPLATDPFVRQMDAAIYSYLQGVNSTLYLNQAET